jgi:hypothetical protein
MEPTEVTTFSVLSEHDDTIISWHRINSNDFQNLLVYSLQKSAIAHPRDVGSVAKAKDSTRNHATTNTNPIKSPHPNPIQGGSYTTETAYAVHDGCTCACGEV